MELLASGGAGQATCRWLKLAARTVARLRSCDAARACVVHRMPGLSWGPLGTTGDHWGPLGTTGDHWGWYGNGADAGGRGGTVGDGGGWRAVNRGTVTSRLMSILCTHV